MTSTMTNKGMGQVVWHVQISKGEVYEPWRWREAILAYLNGVWGEDLNKDYPPHLTLNDHWLRLNVERHEYYAYTSLAMGEAEIPGFKTEEILMVGSSQDEVECGLARFVKNNHIKQLAIIFRDNPGPGATLVLTKSRQRSALFVATRNLPCLREAALQKSLGR